ncbi:post-translational modification of quorum-sensing peptide protein [Paenibacillus mesophilus]|uniref:accessory gene regulator ArgB-like protein n=1 Tax=Paenibacillus mesophilus TaxID=2582849 RepID=UPI00110E406A|nr:accessory gene regulator B family protein [Paenibacillus mesophilus]TMV49479.1 post-translational modification of quorum-sensing peptide protein [Paenibacillus mesophilus]
MIIEAWSEKIAVSIKKVNENETVSVGVMKFALIIVFNFTIPFLISLCIGAIGGKFSDTLLAIAAFVMLRMLSGGYHFKSSTVCMLSMIVVAVIPPYIHFSELWTLIFTITSMVLVALLAPSNMRGYHRMPEKYYPLMRIASVLLVASNLVVASEIMALVYLLQAVSLFGWKEV